MSESENSTNSDIYNISENEDLDSNEINTREMIVEELRLKQKHTLHERALLRKLSEEENIKKRREKAIKSLNYLLNTSQKYSQFFLEKFNSYQAKTQKNIKNVDSHSLQDKNKSVKRKVGYESIELYENKLTITESKHYTMATDAESHKSSGHRKDSLKQPTYFTGGTLRQYQLDGLIWMKLLFENGVNGILADEMGLGKTIQIIALICYLIEKKIPGPFLIMAPLSTLPNWITEFKKFAPLIPVVLFHGNKEQRLMKYKDIIKNTYKVNNHLTSPVVLTSYQIPLSETIFLQRFTWQYIIIDEGHRIKNHECKLIKNLKSINSLNRLLLTGTPLQNNLLELWSLLNYLMPQFFTDPDTFASLFVQDDFNETGKIIEQEQHTNVISTIHGILNPFMLRRLKSDVLTDLVPKKEILVYCPLTQLQRELYTYVLQKNIAKLCGQEEEKPVDLNEGRRKRQCVLQKNLAEAPNWEDDEFKEDKIVEIFAESVGRLSNKESKHIVYQVQMRNTTMMFKRIVNHPFLVHFPLKEGTDTELLIDEKLVTQSGKMRVLDAMLIKLKEGGHKVLLFSTLTIMLDILEDYMIMRKYNYCRLDGSKNLQEREDDIKEFNTNPDKFIFLISTRAGGLGLNLTSADTVIMYDSDWNPQVDIQAQDRCHRIGQVRPVMVYTLIAKGTIDERILNFATAKRKLEKVVIKKGQFKNVEKSLNNLTDLKELQALLNSEDHDQIIQSDGMLSEEKLNQILDRSELYKEMS